MEAYSGALFVSAVTVSLYQMSGTPFVLNIIIFCLFLVICLYAAFISNYYLPSEKLFYWIYGKKEKIHRSGTNNARTKDHGSFFDETDDQITKKLREITGHIVRDFILSWYNTISNDVTFVQEAFELFEHLLKSSRLRASSVDKEKLLANILNKLLTHYGSYRNAEEANVKRMRETRFQEDVKRLEQLITISYTNYHGHRAMCHLPDSEMVYLRALVLLLLKALLPPDYQLSGTEMYIVRELIAQNVFASLVNLISDPLWIYTTLVKILDNLIPERESERSENGCETVSEDNFDEPEQKIEDTSNEYVGLLTSTFLPMQVPSGEDENSASMTSANSDDELSDSNPTVSVSSTDRDISSDSLPSDSFHSRVSAESIPNDLTISSLDEDLPLPMTSSLMHFALEDGVCEAEDSSARMLSSQKILKRQPKPRLFHRIRIPEALVTQEGFDGGGKYTLYRITYKIYRPVSSLVMNSSSPNENNSNELSLDRSSPSSEILIQPVDCNKTVQSTDQNCELEEVKHQVQRRFREFMVLQERLSQNMVARNLISDIKGPSRMFPVPFGNMDKEYVEQRRKFLQAYLRELCSIPFITHTKEMCEFLAYERDPRIAYVRKPDPLPRIDKMFKSAMQDLFGGTTMKFANTLQFDFDEDETDMRSELQRAIVQKRSKNDANVATGPVAKLRNIVLRSSNRFHKPESLIHSRSYSEFGVGGNMMPSHWVAVDTIKIPPATPTSPIVVGVSTRTSGDGCDNPNDSVDGEEKVKISQQHSAVSLLFKIVFSAWDIKPSVHNLMVLSLTNYVRCYLSNKIDDLTTQESWTRYLEILRDSLWPDGKWSSDKDDKKTWTSAPDDVKNEVLYKAQVALESALPDALRLLLGEKEYESGVEKLLISFSNPVINRHLFYHLMDFLLYELFPDIVEVKKHLNISLNT